MNNGADVDQTIQWAREALQRRRKEIDQKRQEKEAVNASSPTSNATTDVTSILARGRRLLSEAAAHSEALGEYRRRSSIDNEDTGCDDNDDFMARFLQATDKSDAKDNANETVIRRFSNIPVDKPSWSSPVFEQDDKDEDELADLHINKLLKEGEARVRLDDLISTIRRQGDDPLAAQMKDEATVHQVSDFDPNELRAAKRAAIKKHKLEEAVARDEKQARELAKFKALPLPGGAEVKHDIFATTTAFEGKHAGMEYIRNDSRRFDDFSSSQSLGGFEGFDRMSMATSRTGIDGASFTNEEDKERAMQLRQAKKVKKKKILDAVNRTIAEELGEPLDDDVSVAYTVRSTHSHVDYLEDPSKLRQQIARLEAKLKRKKSQRSAILNDIVDVDLNSIFERLLSDDADENARKIVDRIKYKVCGNVVDGLLVDEILPQLQQLKVNRPWNEEEEKASRVLYKRQENWARQREQKLLEARLRIEAEEMSNITGKPRLNQTNDSWMKAKSAHDEALKRVAEEAAKKQSEKEEKERIEYEIKMKESEDLVKETKAQMKSVRSEVNKEEQAKRLEKLSQPRQIRIGPTPPKQEDSSSSVHESPSRPNDIHHKNTAKAAIETPYGLGKAHKSSAKKATKTKPAEHDYVEFSGKKFSDMDDKEFKRLVKRIRALANQKVKDAAAADSVEEDTISPKYTIIGNPGQLCSPIELGGTTTAKFYGSAAQAKFMQQLSKQS